MFIEFQLDAQTFLDAQLLAIQSQKIDFSQTINFSGATYAIDHLEYGANSLAQPGSQGVPIYYDNQDPHDYQTDIEKQLELIQPITVHIVSLNDVYSHPNTPAPSLITIDIKIHYNLQYQLTPLTGDALAAAVAANDATSTDIFSITYSYTEFIGVNPLPPGQTTIGIQNWIGNYMTANSPNVNTTLGLVANLLGKNGKMPRSQPLPINTGMSIDANFSRLSFRQEAGGGAPGDPANWQQYFDGNFPDRLQGAAFAVYLDNNVLQEITSEKIYDGLIKNPTQFTLVSGVGSTYSNNAGTPTITSNFGGNVDTPICTIYTDVQLVSTLSVTTPNNLTSDGHISWNAHTGACEVTAAILGGAIGFGVDLIMPWLTSLINPITGAVAGLATVLYLKGTKQPDLPPQQDCTPVSSTEMICTQTFKQFSNPLGSLSFDAITAFDDGISLQGKLAVIPVGTAKADFAITDPLLWAAPSIPCGQLGPQSIQAVEQNPQAYAQLTASISITADTLAPVYIFYVNPKPGSDPLNLLSGHYTVGGTQAPATITIDIPYPGAAYYAAPYPIQLLVATSGGIELVSLGNIPELSQGYIDGMLAGLGAQVDRCNEKVVNQFQYYRKYVMRWAIDPYQGQRVFHSYTVAMRGLPAGARVVLAQSDGRALQTAHASENQSVFLDALMDPQSYNALELLPEKPRILDQLKDTFSASGKQSLDITGQLLNTLAQLQVPTSTEEIFATFNSSIPTLFVRTPQIIMGYDLTNPALPRQYLDVPAAALSAPRKTKGIKSRDSLFVKRENGIEQFQLTKDHEPLFVQTHKMPGIREIIAPPVSQGTSFLVRFEDGRNILYRLSKDNTPVISIEYHGEPWWINTVPFNRLLLRLDKKTATITINEYGLSKTL